MDQGARPRKDGIRGHRFERAPENAEGRLRAVFEHTLELIGLLSTDGILLEANQRALDMIGATRGEVVGRPFWDTPWWRGRPDLQQRLRDAVAEAAQGRRVRFEAEHRTASGGVAVVDFSLTPARDADGNVVYLVPEGRDITERKRLEQRHKLMAEAGMSLAESIDYRRTLANVARLAVPVLADWCIVDIVEDGGAVRRLALAHADPAQAPLAECLQEIQLDRRRPHLVWEALETCNPVLMETVDARYVPSVAQNDAHYRLLTELDPRSMMVVQLLARGNLLGALVFIMTSAGRTFTREDLEVAEEIGRLAALAVDNARLFKAAQEAIEARDRVLAVVAHDLRNPLNVIDLTVKLLQRSQDLGQRPAEQVQSIARASKRANRLVQDLLIIQQAESGKLELDRALVSIDAILRECVEAQRALVAATELELRAEVSDGLPPVLADRHRLLQVLENLIGNAVKFTLSGGSIRVGADMMNGAARIWVADTGCGIEPSDLADVFVPFWQRNDPTGKRGAGLGLSIAKDLVEAHGGRIWVESRRGAGATFYFTLPIQDAAG